MTSGTWRATGKCAGCLNGSEVAGAWEVHTRRRLVPGMSIGEQTDVLQPIDRCRRIDRDGKVRLVGMKVDGE